MVVKKGWGKSLLSVIDANAFLSKIKTRQMAVDFGHFLVDDKGHLGGQKFFLPVIMI